MARVRNEAFVAWMEREGWSAPALAKELEAVVRRLTRRTGPGRELSQITVHKWRSGETSWPQEKYRIALEQVSGLTVAALGFAPPDRRKKPAPVADPVHRRSFLALTTGSAGTAVLGPPAAGVGSGGVLRQQLDTLMLLDDSQGGHDTLERAALAGAQEAVALQEKPATQRTRQRLFSSRPTTPRPRPGRAWTPARAPAPGLCTSGPCIWPGWRRIRSRRCACGTRWRSWPTSAALTPSPSRPARPPGPQPSPAATRCSPASRTHGSPTPTSATTGPPAAELDRVLRPG